MSATKNGDLKEAQRKIHHHLDELQVKVQNSKTYWYRCEGNFDQKFVLTFVDCYYNEIVHHVDQIKHHLEKINCHKKKLDDFVHKPPVKLDESEQKTAKLDHKETVTARRSNEDKQRFKNLRASRCSSSKYVYQWEKMIDEQKQENPLIAIKRRSKNGTKSKPETPGSEDVSKRMVTSRVLQFEKNQKSKRSSSTIDAFLDFCLDKPTRGVSCPIIDEIPELTTCERPKSHDFQTASGNDSQVSTVHSDAVKSLEDKVEQPEEKKRKEYPEQLVENVFQSCEDVHLKEGLSDHNNLEGNSIDLQKEEHFKSCINIDSSEEKQMIIANEDIPQDPSKPHGFESNADDHPETKSSENHLEGVNAEDEPISSTKEEYPQNMNEHKCNKCPDLDAENEPSKPIDENGTLTDPVQMQENKSEDCEDKQTEEELSNNNHIRDVIEDKPIDTESKLELLDDVNALIEGDHLKIIGTKKGTSNQEDGVEKSLNNISPQEEESNLTVPMGEASNSENCDNQAISSVKPRIVEIHYKRDLPPDYLF